MHTQTDKHVIQTFVIIVDNKPVLPPQQDTVIYLQEPINIMLMTYSIMYS